MQKHVLSRIRTRVLTSMKQPQEMDLECQGAEDVAVRTRIDRASRIVELTVICAGNTGHRPRWSVRMWANPRKRRK